MAALFLEAGPRLRKTACMLLFPPFCSSTNRRRTSWGSRATRVLRSASVHSSSAKRYGVENWLLGAVASIELVWNLLMRCVHFFKTLEYTHKKQIPQSLLFVIKYWICIFLINNSVGSALSTRLFTIFQYTYKHHGLKVCEVEVAVEYCGCIFLHLRTRCLDLIVSCSSC